MTEMEFNQTPAMAPTYLKVFFCKKPGLKKDNGIPEIRAYLRKLSVDKAKLSQYRKICGFSNSNVLPITFPHILASPMHMQVLTAPNFPLKLLGLVHIRNAITQHRPILEEEILDIECSVNGHRDHDKGIEFDLTTKVYSGQDLVWNSTSTMLARTKTAPSSEDKPKIAVKEWSAESHNTWKVPGDIGRKYAVVSGDYNPIHLHTVTAKLFGFPKAIAHGMWSLARSAAELNNIIEQSTSSVTLTAAFKTPILLPATVMFGHGKDDFGHHFKLSDRTGDKPHLEGLITL